MKSKKAEKSRMVVAIFFALGLAQFLTARSLYGMDGLDLLTSAEYRLNDASQWQADPGCQVKPSPSIVAGGHSTIHLIVAVDKTKAGSSGMTIRELNITDIEGFSFDVFQYAVGYINVYVTDKDGTAGEFYCFGLSASAWKRIEIKLTEPHVVYRKGANGKLDSLNTVTVAVTHLAGETMQDDFESLFFGNFRIRYSETAIKYRRESMKAKYDKLIVEAETLIKQLADELADTDEDDSRFAVAWASLGIARDAFTWSKMDAEWGAENHERVLQDAIDQVEWIIDTYPRTIEDVRELKSQPNPKKARPRPLMQNLKVKDGDYYIGQEPIILTGIVSPWSLAGARSHGFNAVSQHEFGIDRAFKSATETTDDAVKVASRLLDGSKKANLAIDMLLTLHSLPGYFYQAKPDIDPSGFWRKYVPFMPFNIDSQGFREVVKTYLDILIPGIAGHPSLVSYDLINELWRRDYADYRAEDYHAFLKRQHGDIATLNKRWGTHFKSFNEVEHDPSNYAARYDMGRFTSYRVARFLAWQVNLIRRYDKETPCYVKIHGGWIQVLGGDKEVLNDVVDASGLDSYPETGDWKKPLAPGAMRPINPEMLSDFWTQTMTLDYYRSLAPNKLIIDSEYHIMPYGYKRVPGEHVYAMMWQGALHGRDATYIWLGQRRGIHHWIPWTSDDHLFLAQPWAQFAVAKAGIELERLAKYVCTFQKEPGEIALLFSGPELTKTYQALFFQDAIFDFITDRQIREGKLNRYKLLVIPGHSTIEKDALLRIAEFLREGGKVFWGEAALERDHYGMTLDSEEVIKKYSHLVRLPEGKDLALAIEETLNWADIERPIRGGGKYVELRTAMLDGKRLFYMINFSKEEQKVQLRYRDKAIKEVFDLIESQSIKIKSGVKLSPGDVRLFLLP